MTDKTTGVAALLHEAGETHHLVYRIVDGDDPDWASWYADWLLNLSELPQILGTAPIRSELVSARHARQGVHDDEARNTLAAMVRGAGEGTLRRKHRLTLS